VLWLLRHGDAAQGSPDAERPLTKKGEAQSRAAGRALKALGVRMDACLTSPKVRAADTARLACEALGIESTLAAGLGENVLLVGHDPDFSMAVHELTGAQVRMKKGGLAAVEKGELKVLLRPGELAAIAG
jgi:phosphohistidine phosphatase